MVCSNSEKINLASLLLAGLASLDDKFMDNQTSTLMVAKEARIKFDKPRLLQLDGEVIEPLQEIKIELLEAAVPLLTTRKNKHLD